MRITNNMLTYNYLTDLNKSLERQSDIQEKLSDGKDIHRPSDNPIKTIRSMRFNANLVMNEQFTQNSKDAQSWMEVTDGAMTDLNSIMIRAKELTVRSISTNTAESFQAIGSEMDGLINQAVSIANSKIGDRYIFSGQMDKTEPLKRSGDVFTYLGDGQKISMLLKPGTVSPNEDSVNLTGQDVFGPSMDMFRQLTEIKNQLSSGKPDLNWMSNTGLGYLEAGSDRMLQQHSQLGSRMTMYAMAQNMMEDDNVTITGQVAGNEDLDIPRAIIDSKTSEYVYRTALAVGAKIMPPSLVDFLR
jgi:flagellar hook-associated protein 3 FlgL